MKSKSVVKNPREEWIVVDNCHEPIISQELWDTVQKILILNELIDKIVVHHKEKSEDGSTYQQIEIFYRFVGKLNENI